MCVGQTTIPISPQHSPEPSRTIACLSAGRVDTRFVHNTERTNELVNERTSRRTGEWIQQDRRISNFWQSFERLTRRNSTHAPQIFQFARKKKGTRKGKKETRSRFLERRFPGTKSASRVFEKLLFIIFLRFIASPVARDEFGTLITKVDNKVARVRCIKKRKRGKHRKKRRNFAKATPERWKRLRENLVGRLHNIIDFSLSNVVSRRNTLKELIYRSR